MANQITWFETRYPTWLDSPATFGIDAATATELKSATMAARAAYEAARAARTAAKAATQSQDAQVRDMLSVGRNVVNTIKAFIEQSGDPTLWGRAGLEPPAPPGTAPNPVAPNRLTASLDSEGNLIVRWKASQPRGVSGVVYTIRRAIDGGAFSILDTVGGKEFIDEGIPVGTRSVSYTIQTKRGRQVSPLSESLTVRFGRGGGGLTIASITSAPLSAKAAA
jgi:hypothetical protein